MILGEPIILGGGGGIDCIVIITTDPSALVTATLGNTSISKTANADGKAVFELEKAGVWTITASLNGETASKEIDTSFALEAELSFVNPILENNTWKTISKVAKSGKASQVWNVGDIKQLVCDGTSYAVQIVAFDHYDVTDPVSYGREKAGITFQFLYSIGSYTFDAAQTKANEIATTSAECKDLIPTINYPYSARNGATSAKIGQAKGINASEYELIGRKSKEEIAIGTQYAFYAAGNSCAKKNTVGTLKEYWTRSMYRSTSSDDSHRRVWVRGSGSTDDAKSTTTSNIAPVFCI